MIEGLRNDLLKKIGPEGLQKIENARVGLAGAGGLGSNCAAHLVRIGFKKLTIVDFDTVDPSNLDRQFYFADQVGMKKTEALKANLLRINPDLELVMVDWKLEPGACAGVFQDCSVVAECLDSAETKQALVAELLPLGCLIVSASGLGGIGSSDNIKVHRIKPNLVIVGDLDSDIETKPALSPRVNVASAKQSDVVLEYVLTL